MTNMELILNMLAEASARDISKAVEPKGMKENIDVAKQGGNVAFVAKKELERRTGQKVVSPLNAKETLQINIKNDNKTK